VRAQLFLALLALAGCSQAPPPVAEPVETPAPVLSTEAVDWQATLAPSQCLTAPVLSACGSFLSINGEAEPTYVHDAKGRDLAGGGLTLEWEALTPTTNALKMTVLVLEGCPDECSANRTLTSKAGPSPLPLAVPSRELGPGQSVALRVEALPIASGTQANLWQDVHLTGGLVFSERSAAPAAWNSTAEQDSGADS
jgi:hypothetical protein